MLFVYFKKKNMIMQYSSIIYGIMKVREFWPKNIAPKPA